MNDKASGRMFDIRPEGLTLRWQGCSAERVSIRTPAKGSDLWRHESQLQAEPTDLNSEEQPTTSTHQSSSLLYAAGQRCYESIRVVNMEHALQAALPRENAEMGLSL